MILLQNSITTVPGDTAANLRQISSPIPRTVVSADDEHALYIGNGVDQFSNLEKKTETPFDKIHAQLFEKKNLPNGLVTLDSQGKIPYYKIPSYFRPAFLVFNDLTERDAYPLVVLSEGMTCRVVSTNKQYRYLGGVWTEIASNGSMAIMDCLYAYSFGSSTTPGNVTDHQNLATVQLGTGRIGVGDVLLISGFVDMTYSTYPKIFNVWINGQSVMYLSYTDITSSESFLIQWYVSSLTQQTRWGNPVTPFGHSTVALTGQTTTVDLRSASVLTVTGKLNASAPSDYITLDSLYVIHLRKLS